MNVAQHKMEYLFKTGFCRGVCGEVGMRGNVCANQAVWFCSVNFVDDDVMLQCQKVGYIYLSTFSSCHFIDLWLSLCHIRLTTIAP